MSYTVRKCCLADDATGTLVSTPEDGRERLRVGEVVAQLSEPPPPPPGAALHEASHAVIAVAVGGSCEGAFMGHQPHARIKAKGAAMVSTLLAGPIGQRWLSGALALEPRAELIAVIARVEACRGGSCDLCEACSVASLLAPVGDEGAILAAVQHIEFETLRIVRDPDVREAIREVAAALEERGEISGADVHDICARLNVTARFNISLPNKSE